MRELADSGQVADDPEALRARLVADGAVFLRGLLDPAGVLAVRRGVAAALDASGWIAPGTDPMEARPGAAAVREGSPTYCDMYTAVQSLEEFHALAHAEPLRRVAAAVVGEPLLVIPLKILRASLPDDPDFVTPPHQDYALIQGSADVLTAWAPLGDVPAEMGGLRVLIGSHRGGFRPPVKRHGPGGVGVPVADDDPGWATADFAAGDVLLFHSFTVHAAVPNRSSRLRLSVDYRYQSAADPLTDFLLQPHHAPDVPGYGVLCRGWSTRRWVEAPPGLHTVARADTLEHRPRLASRLLSTGG